MPLRRVMKPLKDIVLKRWYTFINRADVEGILRFMNYGYHSDSEIANLGTDDEADRYSIQLYHHLASFADIRGRDLLEVGCGRGGGISYVARYFVPASARGVDLDADAIEFCRMAYPELAFDVMDAQDLQFPDASFDVVLNVESSHRYPDFEKFVGEAYRVLKPGGTFLFADFRDSRDIDAAISHIGRAGFRETRSEIVNEEVLSALRLDEDRRTRLIRDHLPAIIHGAAREFAGTPGTRLYKSLEEDRRRYVCIGLTR